MQSQKQFTQQPVPAPSSRRRNRHTKGRVLASVFVAFLLALATLVLYNRQTVVDQLTVWRFTPSTELVGLADDAGLSERGKFYLYASQAEVSDKTEFNTACGDLQNERTVVIGCYVGADKRIYIYDVTDVQLDGVRETTAAHEMLHAAYDRLSDGERTRVDELLKAQEALITDERIIKLIKEYEKSEPESVVNELHSIFATEIRDLSPELEIYYTQYFTDRSKVLALKEKYEKVFTDLAAKQTALVDELNTLASDINARQKQYEALLTTLNTDIAAFNTWAQSGMASTSAYSTRRAALQLRITTVDAERAVINADIDTYTAKKAELDKLNINAASLNQSIDSTLSLAPSL